VEVLSGELISKSFYYACPIWAVIRGWIMALLESTSHRTRAGAVSHEVNQPDRFPGTGKRRQAWLENLREVGGTMLTLMLVAIGIVVLRYLLVFAYGLLH
jgi:hypothetical protein